MDNHDILACIGNSIVVVKLVVATAFLPFADAMVVGSSSISWLVNVAAGGNVLLYQSDREIWMAPRISPAVYDPFGLCLVASLVSISAL